MADTKLSNLTQGTGYPRTMYGLDSGGTSKKFTPSQVINVKDYGAVGDGTGDDGPAIQNACNWASVNIGEVYFPPGIYRVLTSIDLNEPKRSFGLRGCGNLSKISGELADFVFKRTYPASDISDGVRYIEKLWITNNNATGGAICMLGSIGWTIRDCKIEANRCIDANFCQSYTIQGCTLSTNGQYPGSYGINLEESGSIRSCDLTGFEIGVYLSSPGGVIAGCRFEVNGTGVACGQNAQGDGSSASAFVILGGSFESNKISINMVGGCGYFFIGGILAQAYPGAIGWTGGSYSSVALTASPSGATFNGTCTTGGVLTINSTTTGTLALNDILTGSGIENGGYVYTKLSGTLGVAGSTYQLRGTPQYGLKMGTATHHGTIAGSAFGNNHAIAGIYIPAAGGDRNFVTFVSTVASNSGAVAGGVGWSYPSTSAQAASFINCDNIAPTFTFAGLPSGTGSAGTPNVYEGDEYNITDSNTATWGATAAGGGSNHVKVRWNGATSTWTVMGK